jgi:hypothetical protein
VRTREEGRQRVDAVQAASGYVGEPHRVPKEPTKGPRGGQGLQRRRASCAGPLKSRRRRRGGGSWGCCGSRPADDHRSSGPRHLGPRSAR